MNSRESKRTLKIEKEKERERETEVRMSNMINEINYITVQVRMYRGSMVSSGLRLYRVPILFVTL